MVRLLDLWHARPSPHGAGLPPVCTHLNSLPSWPVPCRHLPHALCPCLLICACDGSSPDLMSPRLVLCDAPLQATDVQEQIDLMHEFLGSHKDYSLPTQVQEQQDLEEGQHGEGSSAANAPTAASQENGKPEVGALIGMQHLGL